MKRRWIFRTAAVVVAVPVLLLVLLLLYLNFADLSGWKGTVERLASDAIGRQLRINGEFEPEIGFTTRVVATDLTLANADWGDDPHMLSVTRLAAEIDLLSIMFGPITIDDVDISGARLVFETNSEGLFNWALGDGEPSEEPAADFEMVIGHARVGDSRLVYAGPDQQPLEVGLSQLEFTDDGSGMLDLDLDGDLGGTPVEIDGRLGTLIGLINASRVEHDLEGRFADARFSLQGTIGSLAALSGVETDVSLAGPDLSQVTSALGLEPVVDEPFAAELSMRPAGVNSAFDLDASVGNMQAKATGTVDSLAQPGHLDVTIEASGPDVAQIGELTGVADLPSEPFSVSGRVQWAGFPLTCENVEARVGGNTLSAHGVLGKPPLMRGTDFTFDGRGPDIAVIAALAGAKLPSDSFSVAGRLARLEEGIAVEGVDMRVGRSSLEVSGMVGDPPEYAGTALTMRGSGPNLAHFSDLAGIALPAESFEVSGKLVQGEAAIGLEGVRARLGSNVLEVGGQLTTESNLAGTDLRLNARGPNAAQLAALADFTGVPAEPFSVDGRVRVTARGYRVNDLVASLGTLSLTADGFVAPPPTLVGSDLQLHIEDSDISHPASIAGITGLPRDAVSVDTRLRVEDAGYRLDGFRAKVADISITADGRIGAPPELEGTEVRLTAAGPRLSTLNPYARQTGLPSAPFSVAGTARVTNDGDYELDGISVEIDGSQLTVDGSVRPVEQFAGTKLDVEVSIPELRRAGRLAREFAEIPELPEQPLTLSTALEIDESGYVIDDLRAAMGDTRIVIDGRVGAPPEFFGTDLTIDSSEPDAALFGALAGVTNPPAPLQINGRIERNDIGFRFHDVTARLGDYRAAVNGTLGELPELIGTDLEIHAEGPGTGLISELSGNSTIPDHPFKLDGEFSGTPDLFSTRDFRFNFGPSDIEGSLSVDITGKPAVTARLTSKVIDLSKLSERLRDHDQTPSEVSEDKPPPADRNARVIPDEPFELEWLNAADADVTIRVDRLIMSAKIFRDFKLDFDLEHGRLEIHRLAGVGRGEGNLDGSFILEPEGAGYHLDTDLSMRQIRLDIPGSEIDRMDQPPIDIDFDLEGRGTTPHELASSSNGWLQIVIGKGRMDSRVLDMVTADILLTLLNAFNPFAKQDAATELQCGVALLTIDDGVARLQPMAFQSDKMTLLGNGRIDLGTEKLNLEWVTKPRKGIGISASMITNPYIRLGGTLSNPSVQLKEAEAVVSTGAAVATLGLSLVAKGMYDRVTAEKKVCKRALEEINSRALDSKSNGPGGE